jgi:hypothetical protein
VVFRGAFGAAVTPDGLRGGVLAADYVIGAGGGQLGNLEAGALGSLTSPMISALSGGLATIAGAVVIGLALPAFTRYRRQPEYPDGADRLDGRDRVDGGDRVDGREHPGGDSLTGEGRPAIVDAGPA